MAIPKLALIPSGYKTSKLYSVLPTDGTGDFTTTRASVATRVNENGFIEEVASNVPRLDYSDGGCPSLLLEPLATNVITNSNTPSASSNVVVNTNNSISLDGSLNAFKITANSGTSTKLIEANGASVGTYRFSVFAKKDTHEIIQLGGGGVVGYANFNLENGEHSSNGSMDYYGNGWYRCSVQFSAGTPLSHFVSFVDSLTANRIAASVSVGSFFLYGMQSETTSHTTSYIPTSGIVQTRALDSCNNTLPSAVATSGVMYTEIEIFDSVLDISSGSIRYGIDQDGLSANWIFFGIEGGDSLRVYIRANDSTSFDNTLDNVFPTAGVYKIAMRFTLNDTKVFVNGVQKAASPNSVIASNLNTITFSNESAVKNKDFRLYNTALTDAELIALTTI